MLFEKDEKKKYEGKKSIVIYFSRADENYAVGYIEKGNTEVVAEYIRDLTGADMLKVEPLNPYSKDYQTAIEEARERQTNHEAPIVSQLPDLKDYEVIYLGTPIYWGTMPEELFTALKEVDFTDKTIRVFTTHEGSGLGNVISDVKRICVGANVDNKGLAIRGSSVESARSKVEEWI